MVSKENVAICIYYMSELASNGFVVKALDSQSKVDSAFHRSEVDKMGTRNFWELSGKK